MARLPATYVAPVRSKARFFAGVLQRIHAAVEAKLEATSSGGVIASVLRRDVSKILQLMIRIYSDVLTLQITRFTDAAL